MPGMVSAGRRNAYDSHLFLTQLAYLCERLFTRLSTFDIDRSTRIVMSESLDCVAPYVVVFVDDTLQPWPEIPLPDTWPITHDTGVSLVKCHEQQSRYAPKSVIA